MSVSPAAIEPVQAPSLSHDAALAARFAAGDEQALDEVVRLYHGQVARLTRRLLAWSSDADDVVQEVFVAALAARHRFRGDAQLSTWLTRIAINECRRHRRRQLVRWQHWIGWFARQQELGHSRAQVASGESALAHEDVARRVRAAVATLPPALREVMVLRYLEERTVSEVAQLLGLRRATVDVRLTRARRRLEPLLADLLEP